MQRWCPNDLLCGFATWFTLQSQVNFTFKMIPIFFQTELVRFERGEKRVRDWEGSKRGPPMNLIVSAMDNDLQALKGLIAGGADVDAVDEKGRTALWYAVGRGHFECATALLDAKADVDKADEDGHSPLHWASSNGHAEFVRVRRLCGFGG